MTALVAWRDESGIIFAADRAGVGIDGKVLSFRNKLLVLDFPFIKGVTFCTGINGFADAFGEAVAGEYSSFDAIVDDMEAIARPAYERAASRWRDFCGETWPPPHSTLLIGGWSPRHATFELYKIHSDPKEVADTDTREVTHTALPWTKIQLDNFYCSGSPCRASLERTGLADNSGPYIPLELVIRYACAMRQECDNPELLPEPFAVGGQIDVFSLGRNELVLWVAHRWPDKVGEPTDPKNGDAVPATFLMPLDTVTLPILECAESIPSCFP